MKELEIEALKLGIPVKTRHNEVAPNQFELAPIFEECNLANDHNLLIMSLMRKVSRRHGFRVLLHEKPFKGVNGSGKHNNWSLGTDTGILLMGPGKTPEDNLRFVTFVVNTEGFYLQCNQRPPLRRQRSTSRNHIFFPRKAVIASIRPY